MQYFNKPQLDEPLSSAIGLPDYQFDQTRYGRLNKLNSEFYIVEIPKHEEQEYNWRVADAYLTEEDTNMTRFRCYDENGVGLAYPQIYVEWANGSKEPVDAQIYTAHSGGYKASVVSPWPSEKFNFGFITQEGGKKTSHLCLVISWKLFPC